MHVMKCNKKYNSLDFWNDNSTVIPVLATELRVCVMQICRQTLNSLFENIHKEL